MGNFKKDAVFVKHPKADGVFLKYFFGKDDNDRLNNLEVNIMPGFEIPPHTHDDSSEFFYAVSGEGEFLDDTEWKHFKKGDAFKAPIGMTHAIKNTGSEVLALFSTFSPANR